MNSLLQCLFNIKELRDYFINELKNKKIDKKTKPISYYFAVVMSELLYSDKDFIIPQYFKNAISKINKLFKKDKPADVSDLFRNLIDSFLTEFSLDNEEETESVSYVSFDKKAVLKEIKKEIKNNLISKYLKVYNLTTYSCPNNHKNKYEYNYESDSNITIFLDNIMQYKKEKNSEITLRECFEYLQKEKNNNQFYCSQCNNTVMGKSFERIVFPPEILAIILNRGKGKKVRNEVKIETIFDFSDFVDKKQNKKDVYYKLIGSCNHYGDSSATGHYTATCFYEDSYYFFNDSYVQQLKSFQYLGEPIILFYRRKYLKDNNYNNDSLEIKHEINYNIFDKIKNSSEKDKYRGILTEVFTKFKLNKSNEYKIIKQKDIFKWKITKKKNNPIIMDFSNPPKYDLLSITRIEDLGENIDDKIDLNKVLNITINLKDEQPDEIYENISIFIDRIFTNNQIIKKRCNCIII